MTKYLNKLNMAITLPVIVAIVLLSMGFPYNANAAAMTSLKDTMSTLKVGATSSHKIEFAVGSSIALGSGKTITITFPAAANEFDFTGKTLTGMTISHGGAAGTNFTGTLAATPGAANQWGAVFSGAKSNVLTLTFPTGGNALPAGEKVVVTYPATNSTNPTVAASYSITLGGTCGDTGSILVNVITDDQVVVSATVQQTLSFSISQATVSFGTLTPGTPRYANTTTGSATDVVAHNIIAATNAAGGYTISATGTTLTYGTSVIDAIGGTATALAGGSEQFGIRVDNSGGSGLPVAPYNHASNLAFVPGTLQTIASASGPSQNTTFGVHYGANAISTTEAGAYSTTITYTATANY